MLGYSGRFSKVEGCFFSRENHAASRVFSPPSDCYLNPSVTWFLLFLQLSDTDICIVNTYHKFLHVQFSLSQCSLQLLNDFQVFWARISTSVLVFCLLQPVAKNRYNLTLKEHNMQTTKKLIVLTAPCSYNVTCNANPLPEHFFHSSCNVNLSLHGLK